jgi:uncharacterized protein DUF7024/glycosyl transferase family 2
LRDIVLVVTPTRNAERFLDQTIFSVVQQRGDFDIHYHVQDGGSTDGTVAIAQKWASRLREMAGSFCGGAPTHISCESGSDRSMYDAIQTGFERLLGTLDDVGRRRIVMTWINADDIFAAGAFQTVTSFLFEATDRLWVTGIPSTMTEDGTLSDVRPDDCAYSRRQLALGWYDGRGRRFLQQEGTFWKHSLWTQAGGLNRDLKLAGDWDLWRRMARETSVVTLRAVLATHRRRPGQLSAEMDSYWRELDALRVSDARAFANSSYDDVGCVAGWDEELNRWVANAVDLGSVQDGTERRQFYSNDVDFRIDFSQSAMPRWVRHVSGLSAAEPWGRWSDGALAPSVRILSYRPLPRRGTIRVKLAVFDPSCNPVTLTVGAQTFAISASGAPSEFSFEVEPAPPGDLLDIRPAASMSPAMLHGSSDTRRLGVALYLLEVIPGPSSGA